MGLYTPKQKTEMPNFKYGVCVWLLNDGRYIVDEDQNYLSCFGIIGDHKVETAMKRAAESLGLTGGQAAWLPGYRKVSQMEWEDQMETLLEGGTPDPVDTWRISRGL